MGYIVAELWIFVEEL